MTKKSSKRERNINKIIDESTINIHDIHSIKKVDIEEELW